MITMLKRHQIQVLRSAGHKLKQIAKKADVSERSVRRIAKESPVVAVDDGDARAARRVGRPSTVESFRKSVQDILTKDPEVLTVEIVRLVQDKGYSRRISSRRWPVEGTCRESSSS